MKRRYWWLLGVIAAGLAVALGVRTCSNPNGIDYSAEQEEILGAGLTLRDVTLEQQDDNGQLLWEVHADEVTYSPDQQVANLVRPEGELYQDGQLLYRVQAESGTIREDGQVIFLQGNITATGIQNQMVLKGQNLEWRPEANIMIVKDQLTGTHPQVRAQANEARLYDRENRMELEGEVVITTVVENPEEEPWLKLQSSLLEWQWEAEAIVSKQPLRVERFEQQTVTDVLSGQQGLLELAEKRVTITGDVKAQLLQIPLEMMTQKAIWEVEAETIQAVQSIKVINPQQKVTVTAQQGQLDLATQTAYFNQDVLALGDTNNSRLVADRLAWNLADQTVLAEGSVNYQQTNPDLKITGPRARGRIEDQVVVIEGGRVVTEIVPNFN
jgi:LPS export ABC transporter protein LptC